MLKINNLTVEIDNRIVLKKLNLTIGDNEVHVLFGPNGAGKTSLLLTILGIPTYKVISGEIYFNDKNITYYSINERVKLGIGIAFQRPPTLRGIKLGHIINICMGRMTENITKEAIELATKLNFSREFLERDVNFGFSGGEIKRSEILQLLAQRPSFAMLDEPDSGVDIENIELIGRTINELLSKGSGLIVTHLGYILRYVRADKAHIIVNGKIVHSGSPSEILQSIMERGYGGWIK
jgi:Fe-S cluster assembly ATP-binding protein